MISEEILNELDIENGEDFSYFEQFAALMETPLEIDYDTFAELMTLPDPDDLTDMVEAFFEDIIRGVPDNNTALYSALEDRKAVLTELSKHMNDRGAGFFTDEMYNFREWFLGPDAVLCTPEDGSGKARRLSPYEAMMLYREEKLSGRGYDYDYSDAMPEDIDEYTLSMLQELNDDYTMGSYDEDDDYDYLPDELPADFDAANYIPGETDLSDYKSDIDPYRDGFVDRDNPVIDGVDYDTYGFGDEDPEDYN